MGENKIILWRGQRMTISDVDQQKVIVDIAVESWRFSRLFLKMLNKLDASEAARYVSQYKYYLEKLEQSLKGAGVSLVNLEGQNYDAGMAVNALNMEDFNANDNLLIDQMIEPIIMGHDGLIRTGTVMLGKIQS